MHAVALDIHYRKGFVYWTEAGDNKKIMRYDVNYNTGHVYLTDVVDKKIIL
jgi:hypothetical protein